MNRILPAVSRTMKGAEGRSAPAIVVLFTLAVFAIYAANGGDHRSLPGGHGSF